MHTSELIDTIFPPGSPEQLTSDQKAILSHKEGPAWVMAGPGSGKTQMLALLVLRLLYVSDDPIQMETVGADSIFVTTFTKKAARNLQDRIGQYRSKLLQRFPELEAIDISKLRIGTLHGLCNDILQELRAPNYQNVRLMDDFEQALFVREHMSLVKQPDAQTEMAFWGAFEFMFLPYQWQVTRSYPPNRWLSTDNLVVLLNRIADDRVSTSGLRSSGSHMSLLADLYDEYIQHLEANFRCDFTQLQVRFLQFLQDPVGISFRDGTNVATGQGIKWVLVDEYQDTNPVQEEIYFQLAKSSGNLVVVGDDDQAMYRFRGGSVECMVTFDHACQVFLGVPKSNVGRYNLVDNFRSHPSIVKFFNDYINGFTVMSTPNARAPKPPITAKRPHDGRYPAVVRLEGNSLANVAAKFAAQVKALEDGGVVNDLSECCLLLKSTRESPYNASSYVEALKAVDIPVYNPRNKAFAAQEEVQGLLGGILAILDHDRRFALDPSNRGVPDGEAGVRQTFDELALQYHGLRSYIDDAVSSLRSNPGKYLDANLQELAYYLISLEPFSTWQNDSVRRVRMGKITALLEAFSSMPVMDPATGQPRQNVSRGRIRSSSQFPGEAQSEWLGSFYNLFLGHVLETGFDDEEDDDIIVPPKMFPIMTMHQAKGLEFPFVFVGSLREDARVGPSHQLESLFSVHSQNPARSGNLVSASDRAEMDLIRQYYVAYSRAKYALILVGLQAHFNQQHVPVGPSKMWAKRLLNPL